MCVFCFEVWYLKIKLDFSARWLSLTQSTMQVAGNWKGRKKSFYILNLQLQSLQPGFPKPNVGVQPQKRGASYCAIGSTTVWESPWSSAFYRNQRKALSRTAGSSVSETLWESPGPAARTACSVWAPLALCFGREFCCLSASILLPFSWQMRLQLQVWERACVPEACACLLLDEPPQLLGAAAARRF